MFNKPHRQRYGVFLECLIEARKAAGLTQDQVAAAVNSKQTIISKCERGERRLDVVDLLDFLAVYDVSADSFMKMLEAKLRVRTKTKG